jgi:hypothetical protein
VPCWHDVWVVKADRAFAASGLGVRESVVAPGRTASSGATLQIVPLASAL